MIYNALFLIKRNNPYIKYFILFICIFQGLTQPSFSQANPHLTHNAQQITFESSNTAVAFDGIAAENRAFSLSIPTHQVVSIKLESLSASLSVEVYDEQQRLLSTVSSPDRNVWFLSLLITKDLCSQCQITVKPLKPVDKDGLYKISFQRHDTVKEADEIKLLSLLTSIYKNWNLYDKGEPNTVVEDLLTVKNLSQLKGFKSYYQQSLFLSAIHSYNLTRHQQKKELLLELLNENTDSIFQKHASLAIGVVYSLEEKNDLSLEFLNRALQINKIDEDKILTGRIFSQLGHIENRQGNIKSAEQYFNQALKIFENENDIFNSVIMLLNSGWIYLKTGNYEQAFSFLQQALTYARQYHLVGYEIDANVKLSRLYAVQGDVDQALQYLSRSLVAAKKEPHDPGVRFYLARTYHVKGMLQTEFGLFEEAIDPFFQARQIYQQLGSQTDANDITYLIAAAYLGDKDFERAEHYYQQTLSNDLATGNPANIAITYKKLAEVALAQGEILIGDEQKQKNQSALNYQKKAFEYYEKIDDINKGASLYSQGALIYFYNGNTKQANDSIRKASQIAKQQSDVLQQINTDFRQAKLLALQNKKEAATDLLSDLHKRIEKQRTAIHRKNIRQSFLALQQKISELHIQLLDDAQSIESLQIAERYRSRSLKDEINDLSINTLLTATQKKRRKTLQDKLASLAVQYYQQHKNVQRQSIRIEIKNTVEALQQFEVSLETKSIPVKPASKDLPGDEVKTLQQSFSASAAMIFFDINTHSSYYWLISRDEIVRYPLPAQQSMVNQVMAVVNLLSTPPESINTARKASIQQAITALSKTIIGEQAELWRKYHEIVIITDGPLNYLPFSVLQYPDTGTALLNDKSISYAASIQVFNQLQDEHPQNDGDKTLTNRLLLVANPAMVDSDNKIASSNLRQGFAISELPYTAIEAESILSVNRNNSVYLSRQSASKTHFLSQPLGHFQIIHFAMHGISNRRIPSLGGLVFSNTEDDENVLLSTEITNLQLNSELVVLSGCETAIGKNINGEGLLGLSRAFIQAGSKRVIASLWPVQDDATAELMKKFYGLLLKENKKPVEALRMAKLAVKNYRRKNYQQPWQDPFYWAGFVLQGPGESWID